MLKFERGGLEVNVYGKELKLTKPTVEQTQDYAKQAKGISEEESSSLLFDFLEKLGLPKEVSKEMEVDHLNALCEALMPSKKK